MRALQVGGGGAAGAEDGDGAGQDEVHAAALQVSSRSRDAVERLLSDHLLLLLRREVSSLEKFREEAASWFVAHRAAMHPVTAALLAKDLKVPGGL